MADIALPDDDEPEEYHSSFDLALGSRALDTFKWLVLGHILYVIGLGFVIYFRVPNGAVWVTPLFGLPILYHERRHRFWPKAFVFLIGFTVMHYVALMTATGLYHDDIGFVEGFIGGFVGAAGTLLLCGGFGLLRPGSSLIFEGFGTILLGAVGSFCVYLYLTTGATGAAGDSFVSDWVQPLKVYTPWQLVFAYVLAKVLRPAD